MRSQYIPQSAYEGQIRTLMAYIDPKTDAFVVAGGDGTLMEVGYGSTISATKLTVRYLCTGSKWNDEKIRCRKCCTRLAFPGRTVYIKSEIFLQHQTRTIPIGFIPLGKENRFYQSNLASKDLISPARYLTACANDITLVLKPSPLDVAGGRGEGI